ncbi:MAG TPA: hypothetical protein PKU68_01400, partial [Bacillota bacterium]|nr:hypothetical protein [Bacillota bacterium]
LGIDKIPAGFGWISPETGLANHFDVPPADLSYRPGRAWWAFQDVQDLADESYAEFIGKISESRDALEEMWRKSQNEFEARVSETLSDNPGRAIKMLTAYTDKQARLAWTTWRKLFQDLLS